MRYSEVCKAARIWKGDLTELKTMV
jgi:hypothetical protein